MTDATDVTSTLAELERKLHELERELTSIGRRRVQPDPGSQAAVEPAPQATDMSPGAAPTDLYTDTAFAAPPPQAFEPQAPEPAQATVPAAQLIDEAAPVEPAGDLGRTESQPAASGPAESQPPGLSETQLASLAELRRFRDRLERYSGELAQEYDALLGRVMSGFSAGGQASAAAPAQPTAPPAPPEPLFEGHVELGVGPFYDIDTLSAFERRLAGLPHVAQASVRRFEASHAVVDLQLSAPVALVRELRAALEADFSVRQVADGRLLLTFDEA